MSFVEIANGTASPRQRCGTESCESPPLAAGYPLPTASWRELNRPDSARGEHRNPPPVRVAPGPRHPAETHQEKPTRNRGRPAGRRRFPSWGGHLWGSVRLSGGNGAGVGAPASQGTRRRPADPPGPTTPPEGTPEVDTTRTSAPSPLKPLTGHPHPRPAPTPQPNALSGNEGESP